MLRIAHLSDFHVAHVSSNLVRLGRLVLPQEQGEGAWSVLTRLVASGWSERRSLLEPLLRSAHLTHQYDPRSLVAVMQSAREHGCEHVIITGDLTNLGAITEMQEARAVLAAFGYGPSSRTVVPGNHDAINFSGVGEWTKMLGCDEWPHLTSVSEHISVVAVDSTARGAQLDWRDMLSMNARGVIPHESIERVDALLATVPPGVFKILCCHHHLVDLPPDGYVDAWSGKVDPRLSGKAENSDALLDVAQKHGVGLILFGHRHRATHHLFTIRGIPASCSGSVTTPDARGRLRYRVFDFEGARLVKRSWVSAYTTHVSSETATRALGGEEIEALPPASGRVVQQVSLHDIDNDIQRLKVRMKEVDRHVIERVRAKMASKSDGEK